MNAGEIWIDRINHEYGVLLEGKISKDSWNCKFLRQIRPGEYVIAKGRVSSRVDPSAYYTGEGIIFTSSLTTFHEHRTDVKIVEEPNECFITVSESIVSEPLGI